MRQIRDILRLKWTLQCSHRETARSVGVSPGSVSAVVSRATHQGLTWASVTALGGVNYFCRSTTTISAGAGA